MRKTLAALAVATALLGASTADAQQQPQPLTGLFYFAVENLDAGRIEQRGIAGSGGAAFSNLRLAPMTRYRVWLLEASTLRVGRAELKTPQNGRQFQIPPIAMRQAASFDDDGDGLSLQGERIAGTDPNNPDSDADSIPDGAELQQGTDPLDGLPGRTGIIASVDTPGVALDVCASDDYVVVADGPGGISVFNVFNRLNPQAVARVAIPGEARRVSCEGSLVAVCGTEELSIVDVSDPPAARVTRRLSRYLLGGQPAAVAVVDRVAYVGLAFGAVSVDLESGGVLERLNTRGSDVSIERDAVFFRSRNSVQPYRIRGPGAPALTLPLEATQPGPIGRLFVGGGYAYAVNGLGFTTMDFRNLSAPTYATPGPGSSTGWRQIVANGSGLGVAVVSPNSGDRRDVSIYDLSDPNATAPFVVEFPTPGDARAVAIYNGLAYVADGDRGLQVVNYLSYDTAGIAPVITLTNSFGGSSAEEGQRFWLSAECRDDVQVRNVEFWIDGVKVRTDGSYPFEYQFTAPTLAQQTSFTIRARVSDTGGNRTWTPLRTITLTQDAAPPAVLRTAPRDGAILGGNVAVAAVLTEPVAVASINTQSLTLLFAGADRVFGTLDDAPVSAQVSYSPGNLTAFLQPLTNSLGPGVYRATLAAGILDEAGNASLTPTEWTFTVYDPAADQDGDGLPDELEAYLGLDPNDSDTDNDGTPDGQEDQDGDGLINVGEVLLSLDPSNPDSDSNGTADGQEDPDEDGLPHSGEVAVGSDPLEYDTDGDGFGDGVEVANQSDPTDPASLPLRDLAIPFSLKNEAGPPSAQAHVSVKNQAAPEAVEGRTESRALTVENQ